MNNDYFKQKYLKYKQKYLELKGGAHCPRLGFHQYTGQCWNDAFQMIILYSNEISEPIQKMFNNPEFKLPKRTDSGEIIEGEFEFKDGDCGRAAGEKEADALGVDARRGRGGAVRFVRVVKECGSSGAAAARQIYRQTNHSCHHDGS